MTDKIKHTISWIIVSIVYVIIFWIIPKDWDDILFIHLGFGLACLFAWAMINIINKYDL